MRKSAILILLLMMCALHTVTLYAQPVISKDTIPANLPASTKNLVLQLYSSNPEERGKAALALADLQPEPAIPFLVSMLHVS